MAYILALDAGTTQVKAALFDQEGKISALAERKVDVLFPAAGFVEQSPEQIYQATVEAIKDTMKKAGIAGDQVKALGITNQRNTVILWDKKTGKPLYNAMVWQDQRGPELTPSFMARQSIEFVLASMVAGKILWLFKEIPGLRERAEAGEVLFGGVDTWLLWNLSGKQVHATDISNASSTFLFDLANFKWNSEVLAEVELPLSLFPVGKETSHVFGHVSVPELDLSCPIAALAADQQASLFGHRCFAPGLTKVTFGTGSFALANMGSDISPAPPGVAKHAGWSIKGQITHALEGPIFTSGSALEWLQDGLGIINSLDELEPLARSVETNEGVYFVPALAGLGAPSWDTKARGLLIGMTRGTQKAHVVRAALESLAFQIREVVDVMRPALKGETRLRIDGRPTINTFLVQTLADVCGVPVDRASNYNITLLGTALLAGLSTDFWSSLDEIASLSFDYQTFNPQKDLEKDYSKWQEAVSKAYGWAE